MHGAPAPVLQGDRPLSSFCPNCGAPRDGEAIFCGNCGRNFTEEFKGTPIQDLANASEILVRLRTAIGDRYVIERELGRGGMATVFLARDVKHDRDVAIKVLHPELSASIGAERFEREIKLAAKLQHPHILGLYDSGAADGLLFYVMPFVRGESLRDKLDREGMLPVEEALRLTLEVASALQFAHDQGIVHRDIKPENILLSGEHSLIADFGIARAANDAGGQKLTQTGMAVGTPVYMAPEQSTGDPVGPTADLYSLGCMLYEMLAGEPPFTGPNAMAIMAKHLMEQVPSVRVVRSAVPEEVEDAIFHVLAKTPVDRPKSAKDFAAMLGGGPAGRLTPRPSRVVRPSAMVGRATLATQRQTTAGMVFKVDEAGELVEVAPVAWWKRPLTLVTAAFVLVLGGGGAWFASTRGPAAATVDPTLRRIAVLYFDSPDSTLRAAADGITEGIIRSLSRVNAITTISQGGSESVRGIASLDSIAGVLKAGFFVRGELRPEGERVAINYRLITRAGSPAGDGTLTVARDSLLLAQDSLARLAADLIRPQLGVELTLRDAQAATRSNAAWLLVQDGLARQRRAEAALAGGGPPAAVPLFEAADSTFARAESLDTRWGEPIVRRAALAYRRSRLVPRTAQDVRPWVQLGIGHADRAIRLDGRDPDALEWRGTLRYFGVISQIYAGDEAQAALKQAQADLELAVEVNPMQAGAWATLSSAYNQIPAKGTAGVLFAAQKALEADEFQAQAVLVRGRLWTAAYDKGDFDAADTYCRELETRYAGQARAVRCRLYLQSVPNLPAYDIARSWRLADSLVGAPGAGDTTLARMTGEVFTAMTIARASVQRKDAALADSARRVATRAEGDPMIDKP
ncbi:MAG: protein kinase, partial [Gemmatimonadaceae bacterium]|nr:protein kinase [Gemmatimonadaceae bacterium]